MTAREGRSFWCSAASFFPFHFSVINLLVRNPPMPIVVEADLRRPTQQEFAAIAYDVMSIVFAVHNELGRFLDEEIYHQEMAFRLQNSRIKVPVTASFDGFSKTYFLD